MQVLFDTSVVLDVLLRRTPWLADAQALWQATEAGQLVACVTATTVTDIFYVVRRFSDRHVAHEGVQVCLETFEILPVDRATLLSAQALSGSDFEDNVQIAAAEAAGLDAIVTRDQDSFQGSPLPVWSPAECRQRLAGLDDAVSAS